MKQVQKSDPQISMPPSLRGSSKQFCVIVDAYSSGNLLAPELKSRGFECIHVRSGSAKTWTGFKACDFSEDVSFSGDIQVLLQNLRGTGSEKRDVVCVLPGAECGVTLSDRLSSTLGLPSNGTKHSVARRNKFEMQVTLERHGIHPIQQILSSSVEEILNWTRGRDAERFVLKPVDSAGTDGVSLCSSEEELRQAFERVYGKENQLELFNSSVLVQEFVEGTEYAVDTVSRCGRHFVTDIWRYGKRWLDGAPVYDFGALIRSDSPEAILLSEYVNKVLDALGIAYGPAHSEIKLTPNGPTLIESGARMAGKGIPRFAKHCVGLSQIELTVDAYLDFESFEAKTKSTRYRETHCGWT